MKPARLGPTKSVFAGLALALAGWAVLQAGPMRSTGQEAVLQSPGYAGDAACTECHQSTSVAYAETVHHRTSRRAEAGAIAGHFSPSGGMMSTLNPELSFRMEKRNGRYYESAILDRRGHKTVKTEAMDIVIGTATKGQTYLYWKGDRLFELPVSYWTGLDRWVNSPGYVDGSADFDRPVTGRCLECHSTYVESVGDAFRKDSLLLGISCERCHGPGLAHVRNRSPMPPFGLVRDRQIDICAQCHGGVGQSIDAPFSYRPGEELARSLMLASPIDQGNVDVHGNQVILLERSRCFLASPGLTCSTCHDVHQPERSAASYSGKCLGCHREQQCGMFRQMGDRIATNCIDCHMPIQESKQLVLDVDDTRLKARVRNHRIAIYRNSFERP